jgi:hypothetical protein
MLTSHAKDVAVGGPCAQLCGHVSAQMVTGSLARDD